MAPESKASVQTPASAAAMQSPVPPISTPGAGGGGSDSAAKADLSQIKSLQLALESVRLLQLSGTALMDRIQSSLVADFSSSMPTTSDVDLLISQINQTNRLLNQTSLNSLLSLAPPPPALLDSDLPLAQTSLQQLQPQLHESLTETDNQLAVYRATVTAAAQVSRARSHDSAK
ncbi:hypothetical protein BASA61_002142 [Batrachochytrium salamandrivorans]|nr:hypothetical protein BASA61_002142 [Batrachochytrium salamandrivorans]KAH9253047.1 hypothetical protein BASA81_009052 [Batrachochytrium salamandrivorans]